MTWDLRCSGVGKRYQVREGGARRSLRDLVRPRMRDFWALRQVTFDVAPGEVLGVIGPNGAGKSTLLKLLSSITAPTEGEIRIRGRLAALIEVGSGFHPELTGRENVFLSGTILGMRRRDVTARLDSIVEFAGIGGFLDVPVKWYSSGMYVRLGFAVAAHLEPDILLVDEVLAVGDAAFQARCLRRIEELRARGTTIIFISHDLGTVERLCTRALLLRSGRIEAEGASHDVVTRYVRQVTADQPDLASPVHSTGPIAIEALSVLAPDGRPLTLARTGDGVQVALTWRASTSLERVVAQVAVYAYDDGALLFECETGPTGIAVAQGATTVRFDIPALPLLPGAYTLGATVRTPDSPRPIAWWFGRTTLHVDAGPSARGRFYSPYRWSVSVPETAPLRTS